MSPAAIPLSANASPIIRSQVVAGLAKRRNRAGLASACIWRCRLCPSDEPLRHGIGDGGGIAAAGLALRPDLLEPDRNALDPLTDQVGVAIAKIFCADVDDAAGIDHVIGRIEDPALMDALAVLGSGELIIGAAGDNR